MRKGTKDAWIAALRSGDYDQGERYLSFDGRFCCLGVLADVVGVPSRVDPLDSDGVKEYAFEKGGLSCSVPGGWQCLSSLNVADLITLNDGGNSFPYIADWIETNIEETE